MYRTRRQSTTSYPISVLMVSSTDHSTPQTGKTVTCTLSKNGGAFASSAGSVSELSSGIYTLAGNATDRNTLGSSVYKFSATGCDDAFVQVEIVPYDVFNVVNVNVAEVNNSVGGAQGLQGVGDWYNDNTALPETANTALYLDAAVSTAGGGGAITVIDAADAILTSTSPTTDTDDGTVTIYTGASYTGTGQGIGKSKSWTGDDLNNAAATLYVLRQDLYEDPTDATAWTALDTTTLTQSGTTLAAAFNPSDTATAALATGHNGDGSTTYRAHIVATASKTPLWDFQIIVRRGEWT